MALIPVAKGEISHCPLVVDSLCGSYAAICSYEDLTKGVSLAFWRPRVKFSANID